MPSVPLFSATSRRGTCDQYGSVGRAEAIVYIYYRYVGRARVEHAQQSGGTVKTRPIAHRSGNGNDRDAAQPPHAAGERSLHACTDDDDVCQGEGFALSQQAVKSCYAHVIDAGDLGA